MKSRELTTIGLRRDTALARHVEPLAVGVPLARGALHTTDVLTVLGDDGSVLPSQTVALAAWPDASVRWALVEFLVDADTKPTQQVTLCAGSASDVARTRIRVAEDANDYRIDTGAALIMISRASFHPFATLRYAAQHDDVEVVAAITLEDEHGHVLLPKLETLAVESSGSLRCTLGAGGTFGAGRQPLCRFVARLSFFLGTALVRLELTLHNPRRARHRGGTWDLGDPGSVALRDSSVTVRAKLPEPPRLSLRLSPDAPEEDTSGRFHLYQASSGGERWMSRNHVDRFGHIPLPFRGCRITDGERVLMRERVSPVVSLRGGGVGVSLASPGFWQQFPKVLAGTADELRVGLFPREAAPFELQGGEQKTHTVWLALGAEHDADLAWVHDPFIPSVPPAYIDATSTVPHFAPAREDPSSYRLLVKEALEGPRSFFAKRETIDEYGWRNFGDTWADHEDAHFDGEHPVVSHYNNQYDLLYGFLLHFMRSGDRRWFRLASDLARHVIDIDLYHTTEDKPAYSGGPFWHTAHYEDAGRATHRSYSSDSPAARRGKPYGGGPSCEQTHTTGLLYLHYLTGDPAAAEAVVQLAEWLIRADDGRLSLLAHVDPSPTGLASYTRSFDYHGPGRGPGNAINAWLDAFELTGARRYLEQAELVIARCIHPSDDPAAHGLADPESRWSYTVFLQALGKYLDLKNLRAEHDRSFAYARASLMRYAEWMVEHEAPFATRMHLLEYPTESWPAQDMRKSNVFDHAARYGPSERQMAMTAQAERFFTASIDGVSAFATRACTRPLAILLTTGAMRASFRGRAEPTVPPFEPGLDFGTPTIFQPQRERVRAQLATWAGWRKLGRAALRPSVWRRVLAGRIW